MPPTEDHDIAPETDGWSKPPGKASVISDAAEHVAEREAAVAAAPEAERDHQRTWLALLVTLLMMSTTYAVLTMTAPVDVGTPEQRLRDARAMIYVTSLEIEAFREAEMRLPDSLEELGAEEPEVIYTPTGDTYRLEMTVGEFTARYVSTDDVAVFRGILPLVPGGAE